MQTDENRISTGIEGLDDVLGGGLPEGHLYLFEGEPGTGKTTLGLQFLLAGAGRNEKVMIITLSESRAEIEDVARAHRWSLQEISIFQYAPGEEALRPEDQYSAFHPSEVEFQDTMQSILEEIGRVRPSRIVFDSLSLKQAEFSCCKPNTEVASDIVSGLMIPGDPGDMRNYL